MNIDQLHKHYYCTTYRSSTHQGDVRDYLFINRRDTDYRGTSFRMFKENNGIWIKYNAGWETYAPLIVEYCINELNVDAIFVEELINGH